MICTPQDNARDPINAHSESSIITLVAAKKTG
jgi:hypothetical protein